MTPTAYRRLRIKLDLTQGELAKKLGVTRKTINSRENGRTKITNEAAIAIRGLVDNDQVEQPDPSPTPDSTDK